MRLHGLIGLAPCHQNHLKKVLLYNFIRHDMYDTDREGLHREEIRQVVTARIDIVSSLD